MRPVHPHFLYFLLSVFLFAGSTYAQASNGLSVQDTVNRVDEMGRKQGYWKVVAPLPDKPDYSAGQLVEEGRYSNSKRVGVWRSYWPNGNVKSEITYTMGRPKGSYTIYYPNGRKEESGSWDLDRNTGKFQRWHTNGKLAQDFVFDPNGQRNGEQKYYHENGQLAVGVTIEQGRETGTMKRYYANGDLHQVAEFNNGVINEDNSRFIRPVNKPAPQPASTEKSAPAVGQEETTNTVMFRENGFNTLYDKQLRITQQGEYKSGRLWNGRMYKYDKNGLLVRIEVYDQGRYIGNKPITPEDLP